MSADVRSIPFPVVRSCRITSLCNILTLLILMIIVYYLLPKVFIVSQPPPMPFQSLYTGEENSKTDRSFPWMSSSTLRDAKKTVSVQSLSTKDQNTDETDSLRSSRLRDAEKIKTFAETVLGYKVMPDQCKSEPGSTQLRNTSESDLLKYGPFPLLPDYRSPCWRHSQDKELRCLPSVYLAGVSKCGTSDLFQRLVRHPHLTAEAKEPNYFTRKRFKGYSFDYYIKRLGSWMTHHFKDDKLSVVMDGSPSTIWQNNMWTTLPGNERCTEPRIITADYIRHLTPNAKIIVILRNPSSRLYSDYLYGRKMHLNKSQENFHMLVNKNIAVFNACVKERSLRNCAYNISMFSIRLFIGMYSVFVEDWLLRFPRDQMLFIRLEDVQSGADTVPAVFRFLGLAVPNETIMQQILTQGQRNTARISIGPMWNETRRLLDDFYRPFNARLAHILQDRRFTWKDV
ncbi:carbohydrate sulfotransferase 15-like [Babylonia areolata]|uniref:carbohydrate sulfotransferase 15-like n=1 Tax=Babylonia areolata TaxID=304850 RepID=UPI003FD128D8